MDAKLQWSSHDGKWGMRLNGSNIFNNRFDTRSVQGNQDYRMKINFNCVLKTEDIHPPKTGISVHFSGSLV